MHIIFSQFSFYRSQDNVSADKGTVFRGPLMMVFYPLEFIYTYYSTETEDQVIILLSHEKYTIVKNCVSVMCVCFVFRSFARLRNMGPALLPIEAECNPFYIFVSSQQATLQGKLHL